MRRVVTIYDYCVRFPPCLVRLLARERRGRPLTDDEIAKRTGCMRALQVHNVSLQVDWQGVDVPTLRAFTAACGVDFANQKQMQRAQKYLRADLKNGHFQYIRRSPLRRSLEPVVQAYLSTL